MSPLPHIGRPGWVLALVLATAGATTGACFNHGGKVEAGTPAAAVMVAAKPAGRAPAPVVWNLAWMTEVKGQIAGGDGRHAAALARLRQEADQALGEGPFSVTFKKKTPPSGDKHDYLSVGPYWWPDPSKPDGLPYIRKDGQRNPYRMSGDYDSRAESDLAAAVETLGLAYFFTGHEPYAAHAAKLLRVWFLDPATRMNPNLNFSQGIPGVAVGRPTGIIDTADFVNMLEGVELLGQSPSWSEADDRGLRAWFGQFLDWLLESELGRGEGQAGNNHGSWYSVQVCRFAIYAGRGAVCSAVAAEAREARIARQIEPDGRQPRELERTRSFHYSVFNLSALFSLGAIADGLGVDLYRFATPDGRGLRPALEFLLRYLDPESKWPYQQMGGRDRAGLIPVLRRARRVWGDPRYEELAGKYLAEEMAHHRSQLVLP